MLRPRLKREPRLRLLRLQQQPRHQPQQLRLKLRPPRHRLRQKLRPPRHLLRLRSNSNDLDSTISIEEGPPPRVEALPFLRLKGTLREE